MGLVSTMGGVISTADYSGKALYVPFLNIGRPAVT